MNTQAHIASLLLTNSHFIPQYGQKVTCSRGRVEHTFRDGSILIHTPVYGNTHGLHFVAEGRI